MLSPLVSVICISHNHGRYIEEALMSVMNQTHDNMEIIIVDDSSSDHSPQVIRQFISKYPYVQAIFLPERLGNCKAFNRGLEKVQGDFIIDLAADDVLLSNRVREGLNCFQKHGGDYGVHFTDATYIDADGKVLRNHYKRDKKGRLKHPVPEGMIYEHLLARYFICTPTMMVRRSIYDLLGGYDAELSYEDFDFWIRSGKTTQYCYTDKILVKKRLLTGSLSSRQYEKGSQMLHSTYLVCLKAEKLNETRPEKLALVQRVQYELRKALLTGNYKSAHDFSSLLLRNLEFGIRRTLVFLLYRILKAAVRNG